MMVEQLLYVAGARRCGGGMGIAMIVEKM